MDVILTGLASALTVSNLALVAFGVFVGIVVGAIPGLNGPMAIAIAIPLTFGLSPVAAISFLVGINKGANFGGAISAVLMNVPGAAEAIATTFDGYPMAKRGDGDLARGDDVEERHRQRSAQQMTDGDRQGEGEGDGREGPNRRFSRQPLSEDENRDGPRRHTEHGDRDRSV